MSSGLVPAHALFSFFSFLRYFFLELATVLTVVSYFSNSRPISYARVTLSNSHVCAWS